MRKRDTAAIRIDAMAMAAKKLAEGCDGCAQGYFDLAMKHGATEEAVHQARAIAAAMTASISRRELLRRAAVTTTGMAVLTATGSLLPQLVVQAAAAQAGDGAQVAWVTGNTATSAQSLIGVAPTGGTVGPIDVTDKSVLRSPDSTLLYTVSVQANGATSTAIVEAYSATNGALQQTIMGQPLALGGPRGLDALDVTISADGRFLAVLHQTYYIVAPAVSQVTKVDAKGVAHAVYSDAVTIINGIEIFDLAAARSLGYLKLDAVPTNMLDGEIEFALDGKALYVFTLDESFNSSVTAVQFDGKALQVSAQATNGQNGHVIPRVGQTLRSVTHRLLDGQTLVRVIASTVQWFDLQGLTLSNTVSIPIPVSANPTPPSTLLSMDGHSLYIVDTAFSTVHVIDLTQRTFSSSAALPVSGESALSLGMRSIGGVQSAALSPDGTRLYAIASSGRDGFWLVHLPDLAVVSHWLPGIAVQAIWPSPDGQAVFATGLADGRVYALGNDGHVISATQAGASIYDFVE